MTEWQWRVVIELPRGGRGVQPIAGTEQYARECWHEAQAQYPEALVRLERRPVGDWAAVEAVDTRPTEEAP